MQTDECTSMATNKTKRKYIHHSKPSHEKKTVVNFVEWLKSQWNVTNEPTGYMLKLKLKHTIHQASAKMKMKTNNRDKNNELLLHLYNSNEKKEEKKERHIHKQNDGDIVCHSNKRMTGRWKFFSSVILSLLLLYLSLRDYFCATNDIYSFYRLQCFCTNCLGDFIVVDKNKINDRRMNDTHLTLTTVVDNSVRFTMKLENILPKKNHNMKQRDIWIEIRDKRILKSKISIQLKTSFRLKNSNEWNVLGHLWYLISVCYVSLIFFLSLRPLKLCNFQAVYLFMSSLKKIVFDVL